MFKLLILDIPFDNVGGHFVSNRSDKISVTPQFSTPELASQPCKLFKDLASRQILQYSHCLRNGISRWKRKKYVNMIRHDCHLFNVEIVCFCNFLKNLFQTLLKSARQNLLAIFRHPDYVIFRIVYCMAAPPDGHAYRIPQPRFAGQPFPPHAKAWGIQGHLS